MSIPSEVQNPRADQTFTMKILRNRGLSVTRAGLSKEAASEWLHSFFASPNWLSFTIEEEPNGC